MYMVNSINSHNYTVYRPAGKLDSVRFTNTTDCSLVMGWVTVFGRGSGVYHLRTNQLSLAALPGRKIEYQHEYEGLLRHCYCV